MRTRIIIIIVSFLMLHLACEEKKPITQELCESKTNRADCEAAGCTYMCDMIFLKKLPDSSSDCVARRHVSRCFAVVKFKGNDDDTNNGDIDYLMGPNETGWMPDLNTQSRSVNNEIYEYSSMFRIRNPFPYTVKVLGHHLTFLDDSGFDTDPCFHYDPDGAPDVLWEGSCETDWWSEAMWDDILAK